MSRLLPFLVGFLSVACASAPSSGEARVDFMFRRTAAVEDATVTLAQPSLLNELNGAFTIHEVGLHARAALDSGGVMRAGGNRVLGIEFTDHGDISILRTDDKRLSLRAELGPDGKVVRGLLGATAGVVMDGFTAFENDAFESGSWQLLYDGPDLVVGRLDLKFRKYAVSGNFRAPKLK